MKPVDETIMLFWIHLTIILLQIKVSLGQQCTISCTQVAVLRNMPYEEIFEIIENREWENEEDFGADLLDLIRRRKRVKRAIVGESIINDARYTFHDDSEGLDYNGAVAACINLGGKLFEPKNSNIFTSINNLAIQFGFVIISGFGGYFIGAFQSGTSFVYQSDNSPIVYFAPYCTGGAGLPPPFAPCAAGQTCCALVNDNPGQGPCWWTSGPTCAVAQNYVCEYEYEEPVTSISDGYDEILEALGELLEALAEAAPLATAAGLVGVASMVVPRFLVPTSLSGLPPNNFIGPQPGQPGGGSLPTANTPSALEARNLHQMLQNGRIAEFSELGIGPLVAIFDLPGTSENFEATVGIFEERTLRRRKTRGIRNTIHKSLCNISRHVQRGISHIGKHISRGIYEISRYAESRIFSKKTKPEKLYGAFSKIVLVENEPCNNNLSLDMCSKFRPFLHVPYHRRLYFEYKRQGESNFLFNNPTCIRQCF